MDIRNTLQSIVDAAVATGLPPGLTFGALYRDKAGDPHQVWASAGSLPLGRPAGAQITMSPDISLTLFSCTKLLTAVAAMKLVEQGIIALDDDVTDILPDMMANGVMLESGTTRPLKEAVTLRKMMSHTAGLPYSVISADINSWHAKQSDEYKSQYPLSGHHFGLPFIAEPGERWEYGCGYEWIARLINRKSGMKFEEFISAHITGPLGINWHFSEQPDDPLPQTGIFAGNSVQWIGVPVAHPVSELSGGAGGVASMRAFLEVASLLANGGVGVTSGARILNAVSIQEMLRDELSSTRLSYPNPLPSAAGTVILDHKAFPIRHDSHIMKTATIAGEMNLEPLSNGRATGAVTWGGANGQYWSVDPASGTVCVSAAQVMPFLHPHTLEPFLECEKAILDSVRAE